MMDDEIQETVESILGKGVVVVDCEKKSSVKEEEVLLVNGCPVSLDGDDGAAIKRALLRGDVPDCDLLNQILVRAGILRAPVHLETNLSVKSTVVTREEVTVARAGRVVDERSRETKEDNYYTSATSEVWEPVTVVNGDDPAAAVKHQHQQQHQHKQRQQPPPPPLRTTTATRVGSSARSTPPPSAAKYKETVTTSSKRTEDGVDCAGGTRPADDFAHTAHVTDGDSLANGIHVIKLNGIHDPRGDYGMPVMATAGSLDHQSSYGGSPSPDLMLKEGNLRRSRPQTSVHDGCATLNGGLGRHSSSTSSSAAAAAAAGLSDTSAETDNTLVYRDGILLSGPLSSLIQHLVPTTDYYPDQAYLFAFILSSRLFVKPHELLAKVVAVCHAQQRLGDHVSAAQNPHHKDQLSRFVPRLVQLLAEWTDKFPYDFRDERVMAHVREITHQCVSVEPAVRHQVSAMLQTLLHRLTALDKYETFLQQTGTDTTVGSADALSPTDTMEVCSSASLLGQQLTLIELERLSFIGPEEFVQAFAKDSPHIDSSFKDMKKTKNLESYVHWFNRLSYLVASEICKHSKKKQRVKTIEFWIETARECFNVGNFNSLMAIIAGLNMSPISRLKKTWHKVQQSAKFTILEQYMDPSSNFSSYRSTLKAALWRSAGATDQRQRVVIPFFSLLVKDIYFLNEGCRNRLDNNHINFEKFWQLAKQVTEFITWKQAACPYEKNANLVLFLLTTPVLNEKALTLLSFEREPPDNSVEKEHYKILKTAS